MGILDQVKEYGPQEKQRWCLLRAIEWGIWPAFLSIPLVPLLLLFVPLWNIIVVVGILTIAWSFVKYKFVNVLLAYLGCLWVQLKWISIPASIVLLLLRRHYLLACVALIWPFIASFFGLLSGGTQIGRIEEAFMKKLGYKADIDKIINKNNSSYPPVYAETDREYFNHGFAYAKQGNFTEAISAYTKAIEINSSFAEAYNNRGLNYVEQGNLPQAISDYNKAIEINSNLPDAYANRGLAYARQRNFDQAVSDFTKAIEINPNFAEAYINRGTAYNDQGNFTQAISDYNKAIEINPNFAAAYYNRGNTYKKQNNLSQAISDYSKAIEINPHDADNYYNRGIAYFVTEKYEKAWADMHKAEELGYTVDPVIMSTFEKKISGRK